MTFLTRLYALLSTQERIKGGFLLIMILLMALLDMLGVASIMPLITLMANPEQIHSNPFLNYAFIASHKIGIYTIEQAMFALGVLVFILLITSLAFKALTNYLQIRFALMREYTIGKRLVECYLHQPYEWFLNRNSADLGKNILSEVGIVVGNGFIPLMTLIAQGAVSLALMTLLILVEPLLALIVGGVLTLAYSIILAVMTGRLKRLGEKRTQANQERFTALSEAFGAAKELKIGGLEKVFIERFGKPADIYAKGQASAQVIAQLPRFLLEAIAFGGMLMLMLYLIATKGDFETVLPIIALYAFAGYRLMPALQQIYGALTQLRFVGSALEILHKELYSLKVSNDQNYNLTPFFFNKAIKLDKVSYKYPNASNPAIKDISLTIPARSKVGFVGTTGSGKSATLDLILGLLEPQKGQLTVDGLEVKANNCRHWQTIIGYVPQQIYLSDNSLKANIAFGISESDIDQKAVERAAKIANLHQFVEKDLPNGYATIVGERGIRLSGGQRQRIGIARALYNTPQILVLDEATSALDNITEKAVMDALININKNITVILVAHRLSTVRECDKIFLLEKGKLKATGTYDQLLLNNEQFASMSGIR